MSYDRKTLLECLLLTAVLLHASEAYNGVCIDSRTRKRYLAGSKFKRVKWFTDTLSGTYDCECQVTGRIYCTAFDIPCYEATTRTYKDMNEEVYVQFPGSPVAHSCVCKRGRGSFRNCRMYGRPNVVTTATTTARPTSRVASSATCTDEETNRRVSAGQRVTVIRLESKYTCTCGNAGHPVAGTCLKQVSVTDPCMSGLHRCDKNGICLRSRMSSRYQCRCREGFAGTGFQCSDINECEFHNRCHTNAECSNSPGSYDCQCNEGYSGDGFSCTEIDHCVGNSFLCNINARCVSTDASFECICEEGFTGDGHSCQDVDECVLGDDTCHENAECTNSIGSYRCSCKYGYSGNGYSCQESCLDEIMGGYVSPHNIFLKNKNGLQVACTCGENGEELEGSCIGQDDTTGALSSSTSPESITTTATTPTTAAAAAATATTTKALEESRNLVSCRASSRTTYKEGETIRKNFGGRMFSCRCIRRGLRGISRCSQITS